MILKINRVKDFGIFKDFTWETAIVTFKQRNLIYGWNYAGKTTFSKLFSNLEKKEKVHFRNSEYSIEIQTGNEVYTQDTLMDFPYLVKVFNAYYIKTVFSWDKDSNEGFDPILFYLGDEAGDLQPKIDNLRERWNPKIDAIKEHYRGFIDQFGDYSKDNGKFSKQATEIRKYLNDRIKTNEFNKSHFIALVSTVKDDLSSHILPVDKVNGVKDQAISINEYSIESEELSVRGLVENIWTKTQTLLKDSAPATIPFPELDLNRELFTWVQTGLSLNKESNKCKFCDNELHEDRISALNQYYSEKLNEIQASLEQISNEIEADKKGLSLNFIHESRIAKHLRQKYMDAVLAYEEKKGKYFNELDTIAADLKRKEKNYFRPIEANNITVINVLSELQEIINIIKDHNLFVSNFSKKKAEALNQILRHYVAEYLISENYLVKESACQTATDIVRRSIDKLRENNREIIRLEGLLKDTVKGQEELNSYLKIFLNRDDISISIAEDKYVLKRGEHEATNLSEGEKTAIAFAYFLTELKSLKKENKLKDTIVFFDDPISSLDSNHIFQVRSLIQHFFQIKMIIYNCLSQLITMSSSLFF